MDLKFQLNNINQAFAEITLDEYIPLQIEIQSNTLNSSEILYIFFRDQKNLTELKIGAQFGELNSLTIIYSNQWIFYNYFFDNSKYLKWEMSSYFIFKYNHEPHSQISSMDIKNSTRIEIFLDAILIILSTQSKGEFIFKQSNNFNVITDNELNVTGFLVTNITSEMRKILLEHSKNLTKNEL